MREKFDFIVIDDDGIDETIYTAKVNGAFDYTKESVEEFLKEGSWIIQD